ncbi:MAG TPA: hypothetical protein VIU16_01930 [Gaiellaceae bacterium]
MTLEEKLRAAGIPLPIGAGALPAMTLEEAARVLGRAPLAPEPAPGDWHEAMDPRREDDGD